MSRLGAAAIAVVVLVLACGPHPSVAAVTHKASEVALKQSQAKGLVRCSVSGTMDQVLARLKTGNPSEYDADLQAWTALKHEGATDSYIAVFAPDETTCRAFTNGSAGGASARLAVNVVFEFKDVKSATDAYTATLSGHTLPGLAGAGSFDLKSGLAGAKQGTATGLGSNSVATFLDLSGFQLYVAVWQHDRWLTYVVTIGESEPDSSGMAKAVDHNL